MRAFLLFCLVLALGGAAAFLALGGFDDKDCADDALLGGAEATRPDCDGDTTAPHADPALRDEAAPLPMAVFDPKELETLQARGMRPVHTRDIRIRLCGKGGTSGHALVEAVARQVPVRFLHEGDRKLLDEIEVPPHFEDHEVGLEEVLQVWRSAGLMADPGAPVLIVGRPGP